jgi:hypothetical protein
MIETPNATIIGGSHHRGISVPGATVIGNPHHKPSPTDTLFIQNDTATLPSSPWYVTRVDSTHYTMLNATAPKSGQYLGAFIWYADTDTRGERAGPGVAWESSDPSIVRVVSVSSSGQGIVNILAAGTATLTISLNGMTSTLEITAV